MVILVLLVVWREMLLQSHTAYLVPLAALPDAWSTGSVSGLMTRGHFEVSMSWADKKLLQLTILSRSGEICEFLIQILRRV